MSADNMPSRSRSLAPQTVAAEAADGQRRAVQRHRRDGGVDAAAVGQAGVHHRRRLIDVPADAGGDPLDDPQQMIGVAEAHLGRLPAGRSARCKPGPGR